MTPAQVERISDRDVVLLLTATYDDDGTLITQAEERADEQAWQATAAASEDLRIPPGVLEWFSQKINGPSSWAVMFWQVARRRGWSDEETLRRFSEETGYKT